MVVIADLEAEVAVLGSIMLKGELLADIDLTPGDFHSAVMGGIYACLREVWEEQGDLDIALAASRAEKRGVSRDEFASCVSSVQTPAHGIQFAKVVARKAKSRAIVAEAERLGREAAESEDPDALIREVEGRLSALMEGAGAHEAMSTDDAFGAVLDDLKSGTGRVRGKSTGYPSLDYKTLGMKPGEFWILAGRPSMGKSSLANNIAYNVMREGGKVAMFSLEVDTLQVMRNLVSIASGIGLQKIISGSAVDEVQYSLAATAVAPLMGNNLFVCDDGRITPSSIRAYARTIQRKHGLDLIIVDYIQLIEGGNRGNRQQDVSDISRGLKLLSRELGVPVLALSQLNRGLESREEKRPRLSDLRESGSLEQDCDVCLGVYRPWVYSRIPSEERDAEVIILKQRNGPLGIVRLDFEATCVRFAVPGCPTVPRD